MKFALYGYAVSLMPGGTWRHFWRQFSEIWQLGDFLRKMNVLEIPCHESVTLLGREILQNDPRPLGKL